MEKTSMDALVVATIESMVKKILPQLQERLAAIHQSGDNSPQPDKDTIYLTNECHELLDILKEWCRQPGDDDFDLDENLSDDEAKDLLKAMSDNDAPAGVQTYAEIAGNDSEDIIDREQEGPADEALSDEEAMAMMAAADAAQGESKSFDQGEIIDSESDELTDDEAQRLLAEMEEPPTENSSNGDLSDDEAQRLLAEMESPAETKASQDLSDDEAQRLLAEMEAPASQDMSDDDAQKLLAQMEDDSELSADEEAEALLAKLGGQDDDAPEVKSETASAPEEANEPAGEFEEIDEWERNDFQTDPDMVNDFNTNSDEIMEKLDEVIIQLEQDPTNKEIIEEIFRGAHTLKGAAGMFGFKALERVMHRMENLFDLVRKGKLSPTGDTIDVVFEGLDLMRVLLQAVKDGEPCGVKTGHIVHALEQVAKGEKSNIKRGGASADKEEDSSLEAKDGAGGGAKPGASKDHKKKEQSTIRVDLERLDVLVNLVGELVIDRTRFASIEEELRTNYPQVELGGSFSETVQLFGRHMNEIQDIIMKVRMVPIGNAFNKFTRIVRDLSRSLDKKIELFISGETAELDKTLVEQIGDPLIHLIRNSCDHGIEDPETREKSGKSPVGKILLSAHQEGNHIVIKIEDDGKGIPPDIIRRKGIEKGLISEDEQLENRDIFNLIFEPGFSTAEQVTNISGRGVGMDVVKKNIMKLKGMIEIDSEVGRGTTTTIRLPLTLAIVQSLLVRAHDETFAIPLSSVIESIRISPGEIQRVGDTEVYKLRDRVLPLVHLSDALDLRTKKGSYAELLKDRKGRIRSKAKQDRLFVVVVGHADRPTGIVVDQLLNQQEMVIKSMGNLMKNIPCVAGGAVLGHGEVVLVLDIPELEEATKGRTRMNAA
ncbi:chemotaxis protein CheA [Pseudobacteriovorax antillogorgiicola]|uniref:histidine kinase n=1 Tax=Pseudobacteriovorax antillogorgiicola TaxID=1513793 RepID=A0A1Y6BIY4_9BACT|nr:chemotaxis protein CheW [Pseudobacteriovorax antillogorgiicola]TCS55349.1 two-component system chemotaxis sensor kinase CheA [Pseudobacteriovorax antillogorgiicola]SMF13786.1 two-component system, chemotaxis family, sensor kinase CheA [Pseudobacteriovorax antillogorgiicola]